MFELSHNIRKAAAVLSPKKNIFLLSHMRAFTSLFGHIMGSNPEICGYYEMHMGYYGWKSLIRQRLLYFSQEDPKPHFSYMFDKVLHNEHEVSSTVLNRPRTKVIFCLRHPRDVIPSILNLYHRVDPTHELNSEAVATEYYIQRLANLDKMAASIQQDFFYLDAETLKSNTDEALYLLSDWLELKTRLTPNYQIQRNTSRKRFGDSSERLRTGRVMHDDSDYQNFTLNEDLQNKAADGYEVARTHLVQSSAIRCVIQHPSS
jgi:hypothetical protein